MKNTLKIILSVLLVSILLFSVCITAFADFECNWVKEDCKWRFYTDEGYYLRYGLCLIDGKIYYLPDDGYMVTGWVNLGSRDKPSWRYFAKSGEMVIGWLDYKGDKYYLAEADLISATGTMVTGWQFIDGVWYKFSSSGALLPDCEKSGKWIKSGSRRWYKHDDGTYTKNNWEKIDNKWYHFDNDGWMQTLWLKISGKWYYFEPTGEMTVGWKKLDGKWYYLDALTGMKTKWLKYKNGVYYFKQNGEMKKGWLHTTETIPIDFYGSTLAETEHKNWYYFDKNGKMVTGWLELNGKTYYLSRGYGKMYVGFHWLPEWYVSDEQQAYFFDDDGSMVKNAWRERVLKNQNYDKWFYFGPDGKALLNQFVGKHFVGANGEWIEIFEPLNIQKEIASVSIGGIDYVIDEKNHEYTTEEIETKTVKDKVAISELTSYLNTLELKKVDHLGSFSVYARVYTFKFDYADGTSDVFSVITKNNILAMGFGNGDEYYDAAYYEIDADIITDFYENN